MTKIAYNACFGGFSISEAAIRLGRKLSNDPKWGGPCFVGEAYEDGSVIKERIFTHFNSYGRNIPRTDPILIAVIEQLCEAVNGSFANVQIHELPPGTLYRIDEYDGSETVMTQADYEWSVA